MWLPRLVDKRGRNEGAESTRKDCRSVLKCTATAAPVSWLPPLDIPYEHNESFYTSKYHMGSCIIDCPGLCISLSCQIILIEFFYVEIVSMQTLHYLTLCILIPPLLDLFAEPSSLLYEGGAASVGTSSVLRI
jgi:hypothetical protein